MSTEGEELWKRVQAANAAWVRGEPAKVADLFAEDAIMVAPDLRHIEGRGAIVQSFVDYVRDVRTHHFRELTHSVDVRGNVAVLTYVFDVRYQVDETSYWEQGQEVLVFERRGARFEAIWRTQIALRSRELATLVEP
jgi:uncharacterized protein (TIGR02246 family)